MTGEYDRLRRDIDRGRTGDKVAAIDPAAAPLGTDAEAGGETTPEHAARDARRYEVHKAPTEHESGRPWKTLLGAALLVVVAVVAAVVWIA